MKTKKVDSGMWWLLKTSSPLSNGLYTQRHEKKALRLRYTVSLLIFMRILAVHFLATGMGYRDVVNAKTQSITSSTEL